MSRYLILFCLAWILIMLPVANAVDAEGDVTFIPLDSQQVEGGGVKQGDSIDRVILLLGEPTGRFNSGDTEILYYRRGTVTLRDGKVTKASVVSESEARWKEAQRARIAAERKAAAIRAREERIRKGTEEKSAKTGDEEFKKLPAAQQLAYWLGFKTKYPEVSVEAELEPLRQAVAQAGESQKKEPTVDEKIKAAEEELAQLHKLSGVGRTRLRESRKRMAELEKELAELKKEKAAGKP